MRKAYGIEAVRIGGHPFAIEYRGELKNGIYEGRFASLQSVETRGKFWMREAA